MKQLKIPALCLALSLLVAGCVTPATEMPPKPTLEVMENPKDERGICLDAGNTYLLLDYIWQLEEGYE